MKTILFNTDSLIMGGAEKLAIEYVKALSKDYKVILLVNEDNGKEGNILEKDIPENVEYKFIVDKTIMDNINKYRNLKQKYKKNLWYKIKYNYFLKQRRKSFRENIINYVKNKKYDILIDFNNKLPLEIADNKVISWLHLSLKGMKLKQKQKNAEKFKKIKKIVVINDDMKKEFKEYFPESLNKAERIYNLFDIKEINNKSLDNSLLNVDEKNKLNEKYIVACCRLDRQKDLETLISAFSNLKKNYNIKEKLYIIGDGDKRTELEMLSARLDMLNDIVFLGTQKNPYVWMKNAEFFVHSSHKEGFGMVLVEAMITNGLVVSSDCPVGPREILEDGKSGMLVKPQDINEMEKALLEALRNKKVQDEKRKNSQKRMLDFSLEYNYSAIKNIIES